MNNLVQIRYLEFLCKYILPVLSVFELPPKLRVVHIRKEFKISIFSNMALTILFKFCVFVVHSKRNNMTLSAFSEKILETRKIVFNFLSLPFLQLCPTNALHFLIPPSCYFMRGSRIKTEHLP